MAREFFDYDPLTGVTEYLEFTPDGKFHLTTEQDIEPFLDYAKELANSGATEKNFRGEGWLYAVIPGVVQAALLKKGINFLDPSQTKAVVDEINANYPYCKTTHRHHAIR
jgi:hypothetical protein